jgi:ACS family hexuronate transporter-like MFS transporter
LVPVIIIGIAGAAHQAWSANIFSTVGDMFPKRAIATITGIGGLAGGIGSTLINKSSSACLTMLINMDNGRWNPFVRKFPKFATERIPDDFFKKLETSGAIISDGIEKDVNRFFGLCRSLSHCLVCDESFGAKL